MSSNDKALLARQPDGCRLYSVQRESKNNRTKFESDASGKQINQMPKHTKALFNLTVQLTFAHQWGIVDEASMRMPSAAL